LEQQISNRKAGLADFLLSNASRTFYDNAVFFTFAIQMASIITLARANFGVSADGMGAITMKIAWLVSTLTLLPLLTMVVRPQLFSERKDIPQPIVERGDTIKRDEMGDDIAKCHCEKRTQSISEAHQSQRFLLFVLCWATSFYPFYFRMAGTFGMSNAFVFGYPLLKCHRASQIGESSDAVISTVDWEIIQNACFEHVEVISPRIETMTTPFGIVGWLLITVVVIYKIVLSAIKSGYERQWSWFKRHNLTFESDTPLVLRRWLLLCGLVFVLLTVQFWAFFRLRRFQGDMTKAAGGDFSDGQFTFGQIVAVVLFAPVFVEVMFLWKAKSLYR
jgi:hypothetical protein